MIKGKISDIDIDEIIVGENESMLFIYYLSDGEIWQTSTPERNMEEFFGERAEEMSKIYGCLYIDQFNDFIFNNYKDFKVVDGELELKKQSILKNFIKSK